MHPTFPIDGPQASEKLNEVLFLHGFVEHHDCLDAGVGGDGGDHCDVGGVEVFFVHALIFVLDLVVKLGDRVLGEDYLV